MEGPVISFIVNRIGDLLIEEGRLLCGVRGEVEQLQSELNRMQCFLECISGIKDGDAMSKNWNVEVGDLCYEAEDIIETFVVAKEVSFKIDGDIGCVINMFGSFLKHLVLIHGVGCQIKAIKDKITGFHTSLKVYGIKIEAGESSSTSSAISDKSGSESGPEWRKTYHHVKEETFGLEEAVKTVVEQLVENKNCPVVSIWGLGGLGKTTLARRVFHHQDVKIHFSGFAWACISQQYQRKEILQGILAKLDEGKKNEVGKMREDDLLEELCKIQRRKKCLVVLDDTWDEKAWLDLKAAFPIGENTDSKILVTTRDEKLGRLIHPRCFLYQPPYLDEEESWDLLRSKAFGTTPDGSEFKIDPILEVEGKEMAKKCGGLPLAVAVLGGRLATEERLTNDGRLDTGKTLRGWKKVYRDIQSERSSQGHEKKDIVSKVLALSYHDLPYQLKSCFLYFSNFPEDFEIPAEKLYHLWIAESMVSIDDKLNDDTMMDVAERYLGALARRCIVQVQVKKSTGNIKSCRIHDMMREVCLAKAKMHNFVKVICIRRGNEQVDCSSNTPTSEVRRLALHLSADLEKAIELPEESKTSQHLRSMLFFPPSSDPYILELESNFKSFKLLRTLDMEGFKFGKEKSPEAVGKLTRLRYLSFKNCWMWKLPASICKLKRLETLDLRGGAFESTEEIDLANMERLTHLYIYYMADLPSKFKLHGLTKLETLEGFHTKTCNVHDLCDMKNLRQLDANFSMYDNQDLTTFLEYLTSGAHHLRKTSLKIHGSEFPSEQLVLLGKLLACGHLYKLYLSCRLVELPEFQCSSSGLVKLTLDDSELQEDPMPTLERLPDLQKLLLSGDAFVGNPMVCRPGGFPKLKRLSLARLKSLRDWRVEKGAMPELVHLHTSTCRGLEMVPEGLTSIATLELITGKRMSATFKMRLYGAKFQKEDIRINIL